MDEVKRVLEGALDILSSPDRWIQGNLTQPVFDGSTFLYNKVCILGAVLEASGHTTDGYFEAVQVVCDVAGVENRVPGVNVEDGKTGMHPLAELNDAPETTQEDMILLLKKAIHYG